ncbi:hypothetical protein NHG34_08610 [Aerococcaceae bacterium NML190938]|nr:hypothetical protein [Aerococcaceae bacterium NML190938]
MYQDRGMKKWIGFYLAEHSDSLSNKEKPQQLYPQMDESEISEILYAAFTYKQKVFVIVNLIENERYFELTDNVYGYDGDYIIISNRRIRLDCIRYIECVKPEKWWDYD